MKIYFCGSIRAGRQDAELYVRLITKLQSYGTVLTEHVGNLGLDDTFDHLPPLEKDAAIFKRDLDWMNQTDGDNKIPCQKLAFYVKCF